MPDANPYSSPSAEREEPQSPKSNLPLLKLLFGLSLIPSLATVTLIVLLPVTKLIERASGVIFGGSSVIFGLGPPAEVQVFAAAFTFYLLNTICFALPMVGAGWCWGLIRPRVILWAGFVLSLFWWLGWAAITASAWHDAYPASVGGDSILYQTPPASVLVGIFVSFGLYIPLPLMAGAAAYAWWVRRLARSVSARPSGEA